MSTQECDIILRCVHPDAWFTKRKIMKNTPTLDSLDLMAKQLAQGQIDFLEAGDCRRPGLSLALRAAPSGDAERPLAIERADRIIPLAKMTTYTLAEGLLLLRRHAIELGSEIGPAARVFTIRRRKPA